MFGGLLKKINGHGNSEERRAFIEKIDYLKASVSILTELLSHHQFEKKIQLENIVQRSGFFVINLKNESLTKNDEAQVLEFLQGLFQKKNVSLMDSDTGFMYKITSLSKEDFYHALVSYQQLENSKTEFKYTGPRV